MRLLHHRLHLTRNLRTLGFLAVAVALLAAVGLIGWANHTGLPAAWRARIENEIGKRGVHVRIGGLSYLPLRGLVATDLRLFADEGRDREISRWERVLLDFDKTKLARGELRLTKLELRNARLVLPIDPDDPASEVIEVSDATGTLLMPGQRRIEVRDARGRIQGIDIELDVRLVGRRPARGGDDQRADLGRRRHGLSQVTAAIGRLRFAPGQPPKLRLRVEGDLNVPSSLRSKISLEARGIGLEGYALERVDAVAELQGDRLTVTSLRAADRRGSFEARCDYDLGDRDGRFELRSSLDAPSLLGAWFGIDTPRALVVGGSQRLEAEGEFRMDGAGVPQVHAIGRADCASVRLAGVSFDRLETSFSWKTGDLFLRDLRLTRADGVATGKAMLQGSLVRMAVDSGLPVRVYRPWVEGQPLERVIDDFAVRDGAGVHLALEGGFDIEAPRSWAFTGEGRLERMSYKGVPLEEARSRFSLSSAALDFSDATIVFDYRDYPLREAFGGVSSGTAKVGRIRYDARDRSVEVEGVEGRIWPAPLVRLFAPKVADSLEGYRFHQPPELSGAGLVDVTPAGRTDLEVGFRSASAVGYRLLGADVTLSEPSGRVLIRGSRVDVEDLRLAAFGGPVQARFSYRDPRHLSAEISWTDLAAAELGSAYGFRMKSGGSLTGRLEFAMDEGRVETMEGEGLVALEQTELFAVPIFGPLSPLISGVLNDRRAGFERATDASCTFAIRDGVLRSRDFRTATHSLIFAGDGEVDLGRRSFEMTMRMNARGLLGLITLPLRPFYGMFQFRGSGPLGDPTWENVMFTTPPEEQGEILRTPPKAKVVDDGG